MGQKWGKRCRENRGKQREGKGGRVKQSADDGDDEGDLSSQVHTEDTDSWVVLDPEIDVLLDTEAEVSGLGEVAEGNQHGPSNLIACNVNASPSTG